MDVLHKPSVTGTEQQRHRRRVPQLGGARNPHVNSTRRRQVRGPNMAAAHNTGPQTVTHTVSDLCRLRPHKYICATPPLRQRRVTSVKPGCPRPKRRGTTRMRIATHQRRIFNDTQDRHTRTERHIPVTLPWVTRALRHPSGVPQPNNTAHTTLTIMVDSPR